jgi:hypothetical protein
MSIYIKKGDSKFTGQHGNSKSTPREASINGLLNRVKQTARIKKLTYNLSRETFETLIFSPCIWCGCEPSSQYNVATSKNGYTQREYLTYNMVNGWISVNGIDRIDSSKGYEEDNVQPCCKHCNYAKNNRTDEEFKAWITLLISKWR